MIVPTLCVGMLPVTLCVTPSRTDAERPRMHSHAERGNDQHIFAQCLFREMGYAIGIGHCSFQ